MEKSDIGLVGLAVMGANLALNMESKGFAVSVFNRNTDLVAQFTGGMAAGKRIKGARSLEELVSQLASPRKIIIMIRAGKPVDDVIDQLIPLLAPGDIIIDGGNTHFPDTARRAALVESRGLLYVGTGVSGGEEGALKGPAIMPGGSAAAWEHVKPIFQGIAAKAPSDGAPCCDWVGPDGSGHFVKMVHNGIEYGDMQLICEAYHLMRDGLGMGAGEMSEVFAEWNRGELDSYLIQITRDILAYTEGGEPLIDKIVDTAGQKGTGKWTAVTALDEGVPLTLIAEGVFSRFLSSAKAERVVASRILSGPAGTKLDKNVLIPAIRDALYASKIVSYAQGFALMRAASETNGWGLNHGSVAMMWRGGCIIRSAFLDDIKRAFDGKPDLANLLLDAHFKAEIDRAQPGWRLACQSAIAAGIPAPAMCAALAYYDGYRAQSLPANLLQAQRDYFGAHTYERSDKPAGQFFHTNWTGEGGDVTSRAYNA